MLFACVVPDSINFSKYAKMFGAVIRTCFKSVASGSSARRRERRNRSVLDVQEDFEHPATQQSGYVAAFKTCSKRLGNN